MTAANAYRWEGDDLVLHLKVQPRGRRDAFLPPRADCLRVSVTAPPADGRANEAVLRFLARACGVRPAQVHLLRGAGSREKWVRIERPAQLPPDVAPP